MNDQLVTQGNIHSKGYGIISKLVMQDRKLTRDSKCIYAYICSYAGGGNTAYPSISKICYDLSIKDEGTYRKHMKLLVENGYISITKTRDGKGKFDRNIYTINTIIESKNSECIENSEVNPTVKISTMDNSHDGKNPSRINPPTNNNSISNNNSSFKINSISNNINTSSCEQEIEEEEKPKSKNKKTFLDDGLEIKLSKYLYKKVNKIMKLKEPNWQSWAKHIDYMLRIDNISKEDIKEVIDWSMNDSFKNGLLDWRLGSDLIRGRIVLV